MDFFALFGVLKRRWKVVVPVLVVGLLVAVGVAISIPATFNATGTVVMGKNPVYTQLEAPNVASKANTLAGDTSKLGVSGGTVSVEAAGDSLLRVGAIAGSAKDAQDLANAVVEKILPVALAQQTLKGMQTRVLAANTDAATAEAARLTAKDADTFIDKNNLSVDSSGKAVGAIGIGSGQYQATAQAQINGLPGDALDGAKASRLVALAMQDPQILANLLNGRRASIATETSRDLPSLNITATSETPALSKAVANDAMKAANDRLTALLQATGLPKEALVAQPYVKPDSAIKDSTGMFRSLIAIIALTLALAVGLALALESIAEARGKRRPDDRTPPSRRDARAAAYEPAPVPAAEPRRARAEPAYAAEPYPAAPVQPAPQAQPVPAAPVANGYPAQGAYAAPQGANGYPNGVPANGYAPNGHPATRAAAPVNGLPNGAPANGAVPHAVPASAVPANGLPANGLPANGLPANGLPANGLPANGVPANGAGYPPVTAPPANGANGAGYAVPAAPVGYEAAANPLGPGRRGDQASIFEPAPAPAAVAAQGLPLRPAQPPAAPAPAAGPQPEPGGQAAGPRTGWFELLNGRGTPRRARSGAAHDDLA